MVEYLLGESTGLKRMRPVGYGLRLCFTQCDLDSFLNSPLELAGLAEGAAAIAGLAAHQMPRIRLSVPNLAPGGNLDTFLKALVRLHFWHRCFTIAFLGPSREPGIVRRLP